MEIGDLIYIIILGLFMILGFFNDSKKKKNQQKQEQQPRPHTFHDEADDIDRVPKRSTPPPILVDYDRKNILKKEKNKEYLEKWEREKHKKEGEVVFQSSMDLLTDFSKESSIKSSKYITEADLMYESEPEISSIDIDDPDSPEMPEMPEKDRYLLHPLVRDLLGENSREELTKGILYSEILRKKY